MLSPVKTLEIYQQSPSPTHYKAGEIIFSQGEEGYVMYGVISGEVEMLVNNKVIESIKTGDVFGEGALVNEQHKRASTAVAKTDCLLAFLDREHFLFVVQETPMFALEVLRSYSHRFRRLKELV